MARKNKGKGGSNPNRPRFWGKHAVAAALDNPDRRVLKAWASRDAANFMQFPPEVPVVMAEAPDLGRMVPHDAPHQGVVIEVEPLEALQRHQPVPLMGRVEAPAKEPDPHAGSSPRQAGQAGRPAPESGKAQLHGRV